MSFGVQDFNDLLQLLDEHPDWQVALRNRLLTSDFLRLPAAIDSLIASQQHTDLLIQDLTGTVRTLVEAQQRTEQRLDALAEAQQRTEQRLEALILRVDTLAEAQQRTEQRLDALAEAQQRTEQRLEALILRVDALTAQLGDLAETVRQLTITVRPMVPQLAEVRGFMMQILYERRAVNYFNRYLRDTRAIELPSLSNQLETTLTLDEVDDLFLADIVIAGRPRRPDLPTPLYLVIEVSVVVDPHDVERARRRADLLNRAGFAAMPAVAGERTAEGLIEAVRDAGAVLILGGRVDRWDEAANALHNAA